MVWWPYLPEVVSRVAGAELVPALLPVVQVTALLVPATAGGHFTPAPPFTILHHPYSNSTHIYTVVYFIELVCFGEKSKR